MMGVEGSGPCCPAQQGVSQAGRWVRPTDLAMGQG